MKAMFKKGAYVIYTNSIRFTVVRRFNPDYVMQLEGVEYYQDIFGIVKLIDLRCATKEEIKEAKK